MSTRTAIAARQTFAPFTYTFSQAVSTSADSTLYAHPKSGHPNTRRRSNSISCLRFDTQGDLLAIGDDKGRIILLNKLSQKSRSAQLFTCIPPPSLPYRDPTYLSHESYRRMSSSSPYFPHSVPCDIPESLQTGEDTDVGDHDFEDHYQDTDEGNWNHRFIYAYGTSFESPYMPYRYHRSLSPAQRTRAQSPSFAYYAQFQSHNPQLDYLSSTDIDETVNQIDWFKPVANSQRLISCNDRVIKVWRLNERQLKTVAQFSPFHMSSMHARTSSYAKTPMSKPVPIRTRPTTSYQQKKPQISNQLPYFPRLERIGKSVHVTERRVISDMHAFQINSLSVSHDEEIFLSSDDLRVHLWNLNARTSKGAPQGGFTTVDIRPNSMKDLTEVITSTKFHPNHSHMFAYATSRGSVKLCDLRASALCSTYARKFEDITSRCERRTFISELIASITNMKFSMDGRYILTRDFMSLSLWDMNMESCPVLVVPVHENLRPKLPELYDNDYIFDKFECAFSKDGRTLLTGGYDSRFHSYSAITGCGSSVQAPPSFSDYETRTSPFSSFPVYGGAFGDGSLIAPGSTRRCLFDPTKRILHMDSSPADNIAAIASGHTLHIYHG